MIYFKWGISFMCLVQKKKSFWCGDIKSKRPALVFTLLNIFIVEKTEPVDFLHFIVLGSILETFAMHVVGDLWIFHN